MQISEVQTIAVVANVKVESQYKYVELEICLPDTLAFDPDHAETPLAVLRSELATFVKTAQESWCSVVTEYHSAAPYQSVNRGSGHTSDVTKASWTNVLSAGIEGYTLTVKVALPRVFCFNPNGDVPPKKLLGQQLETIRSIGMNACSDLLYQYADSVNFDCEAIV